MTGQGVSVNNVGPSLTPSLAEAVGWCERNASGYLAAQVKAAFDSLEATKHPDGYWMFGKSMVTDWRSALTARLDLCRQKNTAPRAVDRNTGDVPPPPGAVTVDFNQMRS